MLWLFLFEWMKYLKRVTAYEGKQFMGSALLIIYFFMVYTRCRVFIFKVVRKISGINFYHSTSASCTWKLNRPSKPEDLFFGQPITQTALPRCIAIDILLNRKKVDNFSPVASWIFLPILYLFIFSRMILMHNFYKYIYIILHILDHQ